MHNCMPTSQGYQSIGYKQLLAAFPGNATDFDLGLQIFSNNGNKCLFVPAARGKNYVFDAMVGMWASVSPFPAGTVPANCQVTTAFIAGITYIYYANYGCFQYNDSTSKLSILSLSLAQQLLQSMAFAPRMVILSPIQILS